MATSVSWVFKLHLQILVNVLGAMTIFSMTDIDIDLQCHLVNLLVCVTSIVMPAKQLFLNTPIECCQGNLAVLVTIASPRVC